MCCVKFVASVFSLERDRITIQKRNRISGCLPATLAPVSARLTYNVYIILKHFIVFPKAPLEFNPSSDNFYAFMQSRPTRQRETTRISPDLLILILIYLYLYTYILIYIYIYIFTRTLVSTR